MNLFGKCGGGGRRSASRSTAPLIAIFTTLTGSQSALVVDVSSTGVRLRTPNLPKMGEDLLVAIEDVRAFGTVAWSEHGECGIAFDPALPFEDEQQLQSRASAARGLPEVKAAFDSWVVGCGR